MPAFIDKPEAYVAFFEYVATNYADIQHSEQTPRFVVVAASDDPFKTFDLGEFLDGQKSILKYRPEAGNKKILMVLQMMDADYSQLVKGNHKTVVNGSFILLSPLMNNKDWRTRDDIYNMTLLAGEQMMAYLKKYFEINDTYGYLIAERCNCEPIGPVNPDRMYGFRFNFSFMSYTPICLDIANFNNLQPPTVS